MKVFLSENKINYVLYHLGLTIDLTDIRNNFIFLKNNNEIHNYNNKIIFLLSDKELNSSNIFTHNEIPILFPTNDKNELFSIKDSNLIFNHDILKSAFYLLSGYQETIVEERDFHGRFPYNKSIQKELNIIEKPIVNYYFKFISDAINSFTSNNVIEKKLFNSYGLLLTHDIDNIDYYTFPNFLYKIKELLGISKTTLSKSDILKYLINYLSGSKNNPYWSFDKLIDTEKENGFKSCFYFLKKNQKNVDSTYNFSDKKIKKAFKIINSNNCEIGLHGTVSSATNKYGLREQKTELEKHSETNIFGGRQHRLIFNTPSTILNHEYANLKYDSSLCFAENEGFRNSFCLPFKLFDFQNDKTINIWEFPLIAMDTTLFYYKKYDKKQAIKSIKNLIFEINQFHGIFTLLWHNGFELDYPNGFLDNFYSNLLSEINNTKPENILAKDLVKKLTID